MVCRGCAEEGVKSQKSTGKSAVRYQPKPREGKRSGFYWPNIISERQKKWWAHGESTWRREEAAGTRTADKATKYHILFILFQNRACFFVEEGKECPFYFRLIIIHENARMALCKFFRGKALKCSNDWNGQFHQQNRLLIKIWQKCTLKAWSALTNSCPVVKAKKRVQSGASAPMGWK